MAKKGLQYYQLFLGLAAWETVNTHRAQLTKLKQVRDSLGVPVATILNIK